MTIFEAKQKLNEGWRIKHRFFDENAFVVRDEDGKLIGEDGREILETTFWELRKTINWYHDWQIWGEA